MKKMTIVEFVENVLIPDLKYWASKGHRFYTYNAGSFYCGDGFDPLAIIREVEKRVNCEGRAMSATVYFDICGLR